MPIRPPALDDRTATDLVDELLARIPAHTPEWTHVRPGDPGRTLIELFAWLTDTLLYRANLIPERQRLAFLRLLGAPLRPATPASGMVSITIDDETVTSAVPIRPLASISKPVAFETVTEAALLPVTAEAYYKRPLTQEQRDEMEEAVLGLQRVYGLQRLPTPYVTTPIFAGGAPEPAGFDLIERTVDKCLWLALLAPKAAKPELQPQVVEQVRNSLGTSTGGGQQLINIGIMPAIAVPTLFEDIGPRARIPHVWEISTLTASGAPDYLTLPALADSSEGLTRRGVLRLALPAATQIKVPSDDVRENLTAGVGDSPPRLDVPETSSRLVAWLRLRPSDKSLQRLALSWVGINAVEIDQRQTFFGQMVGQSDGSADQEMALPATSVEPLSLQVEVEEPDQGYRPWQEIDDLALADHDARVYRLDSEAGTIRFGDGMRGAIPEAGRRVRIAFMRAGGGRAGNLPAGSLTQISARDPSNQPVTKKLRVVQSLPTEGGDDAETLDAAERRIPALFRHCDRAVTEEDYKRLAAGTPGVQVGRVEVLPRFKPQQRRSDVPGVVSVMVLPFKPGLGVPNPRADRPLLEATHAHLSARRPLATELYVIGCEYVPLGISLGIGIRDGFDPAGTAASSDAAAVRAGGREGVLAAVREALRQFLWPLWPGGPNGAGWPLGRSVSDRELEVVAARVPGVASVTGVNLFERRGDEWQGMPSGAPQLIRLQPWQLPELLAVVVAVGEPPDALKEVNPFADQAGMAVPVVPDVC